MKLSARLTFFAILAFTAILFLLIERAILTPFILAAIFAYILNPTITFLSEKTRVSRVIFILLLYVLIFIGIGTAGTVFANQLISESEELTKELQFLLENADGQIRLLPEWVQGIAKDGIVSIRETFSVNAVALWPIFSGAASRLFTVVTFFFASFFFLKDGGKFIDQILLLLPGEYKVEAEILLRKINTVLAAYLRAQLLLVLLMGTLGFIIFSLLGVRFSLLLGVVIGLAEIVPMIGPIIAGFVVAVVSIFDGTSKFGLTPISDGLLVVGVYALLNQIENYIIVPQIMGKVMRLHPLLIFFSVLAGGQLFGMLGFIIAVPIAASLRVVLEFVLDKLDESPPKKLLGSK